MWARMLTNNVFEFTSQGRIQQGSETDVYLVKLDNIVQWRRQPAAADSSEGQSAESRRRGRHPQPSVQVGGLYALKVCRPLQDLSEEELGSIAMPDVRTRLLKEQACYGRLGRRFLLCRCFAYGAAELLVPGAAAAPPHAEQERPCLLLEYAPGGSMAALLQSPEGGVAGMSEQQAREVMRAAAEVLLGCHSERVIYRDVQPSNIVMMQPPEGEPDFEEIDFKLIDFGTSFFMDEGLGSGYRFGLPAYRAPEQGPDYHHTYTLDTWQLGCLLLHLRTGELPLPELLGLPDAEWLAKVSAVHQDILHAEQHPYLQRYTLLSQQEREVISKCLVPAPHARPMTERVFEDCDYFARGGVPLTTEQVHLLQTHLPGAMERYIMSVLEGEKCARQGEV
ncbi:hypothetical protein OEZ85_014218 [Tetradesmus obliquus]|uniref:Protein kinase domain-containing protein n=1 Tax=Tetradesmus obliquus TaxID=3088 RepID=A0ABY8UB97_TETOB|nr:hypothetical protein OEZ85_014218 [Tetradesmus obliquus]